MTKDRFPLPLETLLASTVALLKEHGAAREIAVLLEARPEIELDDYDNWNGGTYDWLVELHVHHRLFGGFKDDERQDIAKTIAIAANPFMPDQHAVGFRMYPDTVTGDGWREDAKAWLAGGGITNQGRVRSDNVASRQEDGLLFRSASEIRLYRALKSLGVTFAPLPVFLRGGANYARLEPDFVLLKDGRVMVVEVDGDTYHRETPVEAHRRLQPMDQEGAKIERVAASEIETDDAAKKRATSLVETLDKFARR